MHPTIGSSIRRRARGLLPMLLLACVLGGSLFVPSAKAAVNNPPISRDNAYTTSEDTAASGNVLADDSGSGIDGDVEGDPLTAVLISSPANGALTLNLAASPTPRPRTSMAPIASATWPSTQPLR